MRKRTKKELTQPLGIPARNLGRKQMSTDTASLVAVKLLSGKKLGEIKFTEKLEVDICPGESIILPFRYVTENGKPILAKGYMDLIKKKKPF